MNYKDLGLTSKQISKLENLQELKNFYEERYNEVLQKEFSDIKGFEFNNVSLPSISPTALQNYANTHNGNINNLINELDKSLGTALYNFTTYGHSTGYVEEIHKVADALNMPFDYLINLDKKDVLKLLRDNYYDTYGVYITSYNYGDYIEE